MANSSWRQAACSARCASSTGARPQVAAAATAREVAAAAERTLGGRRSLAVLGYTRVAVAANTADSDSLGVAELMRQGLLKQRARKPLASTVPVAAPI